MQSSKALAPNRSNLQYLFIMLSPILIVLLGSLAAHASLVVLGKWAWAGTMPIYWLSMIAVILLVSGKKKALSWFGKSHGSWIWPVVAILVGLSSFPLLFLPNASLLRQPALAVMWFAFGLINGPVEEVYWRGFLFNELSIWPKWLAVVYSGVFFVSVHFTMLGAFSISLFNIPFLVILVILTALLSLIYLKTGSLRWSAVAHTLNDWGNMNIYVFMNLTRLF